MKRIQASTASLLALLLAAGPLASAVAQTQPRALSGRYGTGTAPVGVAPLTLPGAGTLSGSLTTPVLSSLPALAAPQAAGTSPKRLSTPSRAVGASVPLAVSAAAPAAVSAAALARTPDASRPSPARTVSESADAAEPHLAASSAESTRSESLPGTSASLHDILSGAKSEPSYIANSNTEEVSSTRRFQSLARGSECSAPARATPAPVPEVPSSRGRRDFAVFSAGIAAVKVGIESLNLAIPILLLSQAHAAAAIGALYTAAELVGLVSGMAAGPLVDRWGPKKTMALTVLAQAASIAAVPLSLAAWGAAALPAVFALFVLNGAVGEVFDVARKAAVPRIVGRDEGILREHNGRLYVWREIAATAGVYGAGLALKALGAAATIWLHPAFYAAALVAFLRSGSWASVEREPSLAPAKASPGLLAEVRSWWKEVRAGARVVLNDPVLRLAALVNAPNNVVHKLFHTLIAVVYAATMLSDAALAAPLLAAWNLGELAGAWFFGRHGKGGRLAGWLRFSAAALSVGWAFWLVPSIWVAAPAAFVLAASMIGIELGVASTLQARIPEKDLGSATAFVSTTGRAAGLGAVLAAGWLFDAFPAGAGFLALAVLFTAASAFYVLLSGRSATSGTGRASPSDGPSRKA